MNKLIGIHDREGRHLVPGGGWCLDTIALSENPASADYADLHPGVNWIVRANWGYGTTGTLPTPDRYGEFAARLAAYVAASRGCSRWIIGNEPNRGSVEWPNGVPIYPVQYAGCYLRCRSAIHDLPGHERDEVLLAPIGPWNAELRYAGNPSGDWIIYFLDVIRATGGVVDGFALHTYTHGYDPGLVTSEARMQPPFGNRHYEFRAYRDFLAVIPTPLRDRPVYITEANGDGPWQARGLIPAMLREIDQWNAQGSPKIQCVVFYRYPRYDQYYMEGKPDVLSEFRQAAVNSPESPTAVSSARGASAYIPVAPSGGIDTVPPAPTLPPRAWDSRLDARGVRVEEAQAAPGQIYWRLVRGQWYDEQEADRIGPDHHILVDVVNEAGGRIVDVPLLVSWPGGNTRIRTEVKAGEPWSANFPMSKSLNEFNITVVDGKPSDRVTGIGMGADGNSGIHTSTMVVFRRTQAPASAQPQRPVTQPQQVTVPELTHPVQDPQYRVVTQPFGVNGDYYKRYAVDGVPLKGHNGLDFGTPVGSKIVAVDDGAIVETAFDPDGYGTYVKIRHAWGESLYAHLNNRAVDLRSVHRGELIGLSGDTGKVTGAHLHFGLRIAPFNRKDGWGGYSDPAPYLQAAPAQPDIWAIVQEAAREFGVDRYLLASLLWAESSWRPSAMSSAGAKGLGQIMDSTWQEWSAQVGASDPFVARDNARVAAAYLRYLLRTLGNERAALYAYAWGIGRVLEGKTPPDEVADYAEKIVFGRDLLAAGLSQDLGRG